MRRPLIPLLGIVAFALVASTACGGDDSNAEQTAAPSATASADSDPVEESVAEPTAAPVSGLSPEVGAEAEEACDAVTTGGYGAHSDPEVLTSPPSGSPFGDGSTLAFQYDPSKVPADGSFGYDLAYIADGGEVIAMGGAPFPDVDLAAGTFSTSFEVFNSNAFGHAGLMTVTLTQNAHLGDDGLTGDTTEIGQYCITFVGS